MLNIYYKENFLQFCIGADLYQHAGTNLQKATTFSRSPVNTTRELQPPEFNTNLYWQRVSTLNRSVHVCFLCVMCYYVITTHYYFLSDL